MKDDQMEPLEVLKWMLMVLVALLIFCVGGYFGAKNSEDRIASQCATSQASVVGKTQLFCVVAK